jgi:predicted permease
MGSNFVVEGRTGDGSSILSYWRVISDGYFETLRIRRVEGRAFDRRDREGAPGVAIVTESFARRAWPGGGAVGRRIGWGSLDQPLIVVGVVSDIRVSPAAAPAPHVYMPFAQVPERLPQDLVVRADAAPAAAIDAVRRTIWSLDPHQPVAGIATFETLLERSMGRRRFQLTLLTLFAGIAASLALIGIYGVLSYVVGQMSAELGIRLALGASPGRLVWVVMRMGLSTAGTGIAIGIVLAVWSAGLLRGFLFGVDARDPMTYAVVAGLLLLAAATACLLPARRAAIVDPLRALRSP